MTEQDNDNNLSETVPLAKADVCLLFGNNAHAEELALRAALLYRQGFFKTIVSSGGSLMKNGRKECDVMRDVLIANGVAKEDILIEDKAHNTGENAAYSKALLEQKFGKDKIKSAVTIYHIHAARRALMTLEQQWPELIKMLATTNCYPVPKKLWYTDPAFKSAVLSEFNKVAPYKAKGFIAEIDPEKIKRQAATLPRSYKVIHHERRV
jgi:uncharacterized SAM-binding protein YcdF (DUF218 family)